ncbi:MAG: GH3 auxin-responsive promoter family protein [Balneolaceae bacterium]|nr:GH3 auxin-responsive promoter family protein [Balneolaceae bacterium]
MKSPRINIKQQQWNELKSLLDTAVQTKIGQKCDLENIENYNDFQNRIPIHSYSDIKKNIQRLKEGVSDVYWPGKIQQFAVSAGTSGEGKHLPFTDTRRQSDRRFMRKVVMSYLKQRPNIFRLAGRHLSMPGSVEDHGNLKIGEISGFTALYAPGWLSMLQVEDPKKLTTLSFRDKFDLLLDKAIDANLKVITAVPSWILTLFQEALKKTDQSSIADVWPNLKLLVCGGVKLANYRPHLQQLAKGLSLDFIETYGASEGYIGFTDDLDKTDLHMVIDNGIFFECIPHPLPNTDASSIQETVPLWEVETGIPYGLLMTTNAGLWRYTLNDIIEFTSVAPPRFEVKGRVNDMLDDFGEALYLYEAQHALDDAAENLNKKIGTFTISPVMESEDTIPHHRWFVQFTTPVHTETLSRLAVKIDEKLQQINRHYAIRRETDALGAPEVKSITQSDINRWMERNNKANAQGKLPKVLPRNTDSLLN